MTTSPCVRNCCLDQQDCCLGCGRLLADILQWQQASEPQRALIVNQAQRRLALRQAGARHRAASLCE